MRTGLTETVRIKALVVQKDQRGKGVGAALLDHCVQTYDAAGFRLIYGQLVTRRAVGSVLLQSRFHGARARRGCAARPRIRGQLRLRPRTG
ncbi:GNAT family N-acetyltransferase [Nocardia sp. CA-107356]|uniref:GNAT family N-acetyltransferase n=1 Tax=Nocardia sp. CA-107356 TaxID=3239972 RepID=UPI003D8B10E3